MTALYFFIIKRYCIWLVKNRIFVKTEIENLERQKRHTQIIEHIYKMHSYCVAAKSP